LARHDVQVVQYGPSRFTDRQPLDQLAIHASGEPVGDERRSLRAFFRRMSEALEQARRRERTNALGDGTAAASATAVFTVLSTSASRATCSAGVVGWARRSGEAVVSSQPAMLAAPPRNSSALGTSPAR